ncbi:MAG: replication initiation protein [Treponema sp.]|jgi:plasmid replication initiation protein|nr:replication initiation protein [Treponema sp.]
MNTTDSIVTPVNTPESLGLTPKYELKHLAIVRSAHNFSATAQKLTAMALSLLPLDLSVREVKFSFMDFCRAVGFGDGAEQYRIFEAAVKECLGRVIEVDIPVITKWGKKKRSWQKFTWFDFADFNIETGMCTMRFNTELANFLVEFKKLYSKISLKDIGKLQSRFAIRLFEIAKSWESEKGKNGNKKGMWYFDETIEDFRLIMGIGEDDYKRTDNLKQFVVDRPINEINEAGLGLELKGKSIKSGRNVSGYRVDCKEVARTVTPRKGRKVKGRGIQLALPTSAGQADNRQDRELDRLQERYPNEFAELYAAELDKPSPFMAPNSEFKRHCARAVSLQTLQDRHGIVK